MIHPRISWRHSAQTLPGSHYHMHAIGNGMTSLNSLPGIVLFVIGFFILRGCPANSSRIKQNFSSHQRSDSCCFRIPLIPADQHSDSGKFCFENFIAKIAGSEIEFFIISRIIRNMHFAIFAQISSIGIITAVVL